MWGVRGSRLGCDFLNMASGFVRKEVFRRFERYIFTLVLQSNRNKSQTNHICTNFQHTLFRPGF